MDLVLVRHGNTFEPGVEPYWVGLEQDLPLTSEGEQQAINLGVFLNSQLADVPAIYTSELARAHKTAELIKAQLRQLPPIILEKRLEELNYGKWGGLTNKQIVEQYGQSCLDEWQVHGRWPPDAEFSKSFTEINTEVLSLVKELLRIYKPSDTVVLVSSNGRLRFFLNLVREAYVQYQEKNLLKVRTGAYCLLRYCEQQWQILSWNKRPGF